MTTERTDKSLTPVRLLFASCFLTQIDTEQGRPSHIKPPQPEQIKEAACEWTFDREITKECEMTAAQWRTTDPDATAKLLKWS